MSNTIITDDQPSAPAAAEPSTPRSSKADVLLKLLARPRGATLAELSAAAGWQPHSVRAHLTRLRKKGRVLIKERRKSGETAYRLGKAAR